jgi:hypothetical protein
VSVVAEIWKWVIIVVLAIGLVGAIMQVGRPRAPLTPGTALFVTIWNLGVIAGIAVYWRTS